MIRLMIYLLTLVLIINKSNLKNMDRSDGYKNVTTVAENLMNKQL